MVSVFHLLAVRTPLLLILDDAHWADNGTLLLLRHLARRLRQSPVLIVTTYREIELEEARPLAEVLHDLNRERLATRIKLPRLDRQETHDLLAALFAEEITPEFLDGIFRETEGNPFFVEEVCKALVESGKWSFSDGRWLRPAMEELEIPQSVRLAIQTRVAKLTEPTKETLYLAAIFGREFDYGLLAAASELDAEALLDALERAEHAQLIDEVKGQREVAFSFTHALIPSTLSEGLSALRRRKLHRRAAAAIEALRPDDHESLAHHYAQAGERVKAIDYSHRAAGRAQAVHAYDLSKRYLVSALNLLDAGEMPETRLALLEELADAHRMLGEPAEAIPLFQEALTVWGGLPNAGRLTAIRLHRKIVDTVARMTRFADRQHFEAARRSSRQTGLELAERESAHPEIVQLWIALSFDAGGGISDPADWDEAERCATTAVAMAEELDDPGVLSAALRALGQVHGARGLYHKRLQASLRRLALSQEAGFNDVLEKANILLEASWASHHVGHYSEAISYAEQAERLSEQARAVGLQVPALRSQGHSWFWLDRWDKVMEIDRKWRTLEPSYANFYERAGPMCFMISLSASVHALRGEADNAARLRGESFAIMSDVSGPPERWDRGNHY